MRAVRSCGWGPRKCIWTAAGTMFAVLAGGSAAGASTKVDYGPISHMGLKKLGAASTSKKPDPARWSAGRRALYPGRCSTTALPGRRRRDLAESGQHGPAARRGGCVASPTRRASAHCPSG